ncbi:MAG: cupin domain-containing protein [Telmatospirillum sp.]|nr:cupin domain-containing protein [Telmatospirillum sp.]
MTKNTKPPKEAPNGTSRDLQIGARVRHARILAGIRMRELAEKIGCAESSISKIESGRVVPSVPMLQRIVEALGRDLSSFFGADLTAPGIIQRAGQRVVTKTDPIRDGKGISYERMVSFGHGNLLEANIHVVEPGGGRVDRVTHQGETLGYVIEGSIELTIEETPYLLTAGDSFSYKNHLTSRYRNPGATTARVLWVNTPQVH